MVLGNVFALYNSRGIPLDIVFGILRQQNAIPCWISFYEDARECGWKDEKIVTTIEQFLRDNGETDFADEVARRLRAYIQHLGR